MDILERTKELEKQGYKLIVEDSQMEVRIDPKETQGYVLFFKNKNIPSIDFPRGTLEELARTDRITGKNILKNSILPLGFAFVEDFLIAEDLNHDSINAIVTKAYLKEQENYQNWLREQEKVKD